MCAVHTFYLKLCSISTLFCDCCLCSIDATADSHRLGRLVNHAKIGSAHTRLVAVQNVPHLCLFASRRRTSSVWLRRQTAICWLGKIYSVILVKKSVFIWYLITVNVIQCIIIYIRTIYRLHSVAEMFLHDKIYILYFELPISILTILSLLIMAYHISSKLYHWSYHYAIFFSMAIFSHVELAAGHGRPPGM